MMRPARGTWCDDCHEKGHVCDAEIMVGGEALCLACADGVPCKRQSLGAALDKVEERKPAATIVAQANSVLAPELAEGYLIPRKERARIIQAGIKKAKDRSDAKKRKSTLSKEKVIAMCKEGLSTLQMANELDIHRTTINRFIKAQGIAKPKGESRVEATGAVPISEDIQNQVRMDLATMAPADAAKKNGISAYYAKRIAANAGIPVISQRANTLAKSEQKPIVIDDRQSAGIDAFIRTEEPARIVINFEFSDSDAVHIFAKLSSADKGNALKAVLEASLRR